MATVVRRRARPTPVAAAVAEFDYKKRMIFEYVDINDIEPYPFNPRDNEKAIPAVANSIKAFGFRVPVVLDSNNVLVAGHTRVEAAKLLGFTEVPAIRADDMTQEQINAFRLIDNKVAEGADWDHDLLAGEISKLGDMGLDWTQFGWNQMEIDCLSEVVSADCLDAAQTAQQAIEDSAGNQNRRAPTRARFVLGELVFFIESGPYRSWVDGLRQLHDFNEEAITRELKRRLGIVE